ncbi:MAG: cobalamin biosynthesis protein [Candidatus Thermoplasmatota archaeon]|nr:cobalamin biosynthesis protein [Candidatus Thermoplasmatota archaeon]
MNGKKLAIVVITENGMNISKKITSKYPVDIFTNGRGGSTGTTINFISLQPIIKELLEKYDTTIFIMALGAVVRLISPYLKDKFTDNTVLSIDDSGKFVIPVIGGHHGANDMAREIAEIIDAIPVITTASDVTGVISLESIAEKYSMAFKNIENLNKISGDIVNGIPINVINKTCLDIPELNISGDGNRIMITYEEQDNRDSLIMVPRVLDLGIGFSTDASYTDMKIAINTVMEKYGFYSEAIRSISTINIKEGNMGLKQIATDLKCSVNYYTPEMLNENSKNLSEVVYRATGAYSVANPSARIASSGGKELVAKEIINNVTISVFLHGC